MIPLFIRRRGKDDSRRLMKYSPYWRFKLCLICLVICQADLFSQEGEIIPLTPDIGTEIDAAENVYYNIFPGIKGFKNAQFFEFPNHIYIAQIVFVEYSNQRTTKKKFTLRQITTLQNHLLPLVPMPEEYRKQIKSDFTYLNTVEVINEIPLNQYVVIHHRDGKNIRGTLNSFDEKYLNIQTPLKILRVPIWKMNSIAYKTSIVDRSSWKKYFLFLSAGIGVGVTEVWNDHRDPSNENIWYNRFMGLMFGLILSNELQQVTEIILTPKTDFALTPEDQKNDRINIIEKI